MLRKRHKGTKESSVKENNVDPITGVLTPTYTSTNKKVKDTSVLYRLALVVVLIAVFYSVREALLEDDEKNSLAVMGEFVKRRMFKVQCSKDYDDSFQGCSPKKKCARVIMDGLFTEEEINGLLSIAAKGMKHGGSSGGPTILDLHSGALSYKDKFINIYKAKQDVFAAKDFKLYNQVKDKIHNTIAKEFSIPPQTLYLTYPTFFSKITAKPAKTVHDEYWHEHVDRKTYGTFDYTSLLYLSDYSKDFLGGRFVFVDKDANRTVEPKAGRLSFFTSGSENVHRVEKVENGTRFAMTVSFTCNREAGISNPSGKL